MKPNRFLPSLCLALVFAASTFAADLRIATLNTFLLFDPAIGHNGKVDEENQMTPAQYREKVVNLASMTKGFNVVGLQEAGGRSEIEALARAAGLEWGFANGRDTATGQNTGVLYRLPGWKVTVVGRVKTLDLVLSKHLLLTAEQGTTRVFFLVVHLLRPIGAQADKQQNQIRAVTEWAQTVRTANPGAVVVIIGDMNSKLKAPVFAGANEANQSINYEGTHLDRSPYDRLAVFGPGKWSSVSVILPPYGKRPASPVKRVWTDHAVLGATLTVP